MADSRFDYGSVASSEEDPLLKWFCIIISHPNGDWVCPELFWPRFRVMDEYGKQKINAFGKIMTEPLKKEDMEIRFKMTVATWQAHKEKRDNACEALKMCTDAMKNYFNEQKCAIIFHGKSQDKKEKFSKFDHLHVIVEYKCRDEKDHISTTSAYRTLKAKLLRLSDNDYNMSSEVFRSKENYVKYLCQPPRIYLGSGHVGIGKMFRKWKDFRYGTNTPQPLDELTESHEEIWLDTYQPTYAFPAIYPARNVAEPENPNSAEPTYSQPKKNITSRRIEKLTQLMVKYDQIDKRQLAEVIFTKGSDFEKAQFDDCLEAQNNRHIFSVATFKAELKTTLTERDSEGVKYSLAHYVMQLTKKDIEELAEQLKSQRKETRDQFLSVKDTLSLYREWIAEQGFDCTEFMLDLYIVSDMIDPKQNCFYIYGVSNSGKTYWTSAFLYPFIQQKKVGMALNSAQFRYGDCKEKIAIFADEHTRLDNTTIDEFKGVAGGQDTLVNKKYGDPFTLTRTPLFIASNYNIMECVHGEKDAVINRCRVWKTTKPSSVLARYEGRANPRFFTFLFKSIKEFIRQNPIEESLDDWIASNIIELKAELYDYFIDEN